MNENFLEGDLMQLIVSLPMNPYVANEEIHSIGRAL